MRTGITQKTYSQRAEILYEICVSNTSVLRLENEVINCCVSIPWLAQRLFRLVPSFIEECVCEKCQKELPEWRRQLTATSIKHTELSGDTNLISKYVAMNFQTNCPFEDCKEEKSVRKVITEIGTFQLECKSDGGSKHPILT